MGLPVKVVQKRYLVKNAALGLSIGARGCNPFVPLLYHFYWLPVCVSSQSKVLMMTYKTLNGLGPKYLMDHSFLHESAHSMEVIEEGSCVVLSPLWVS